jgi:hypothetical protein
MSNIDDNARDAADKMQAGERQLQRRSKTQDVIQTQHTTRKRLRKK